MQNNNVIEIISALEKSYPNSGIRLNYGDCFQLLTAVILSAQCTDERVNIITENLFKRYKTIEEFAKSDIEELEKLILSAGYYKAKAKSIKGAANMIIDEYDTKIPNSMNEILKIPGVGRKTANVMLGHCYNIPGIVVDTHVIRLSQRIGLVDCDSPEKIERELLKIVPENKQILFTHLFISLGRDKCKARKPDCATCPILEYCNRIIVKKS